MPKSLRQVILDRKLTPRQLRRLQREAYDFVIRNSETIADPNFRSIGSQDLGLVFQITDELFFSGLVGQTCEAKSLSPLKFRLSKRMTTSGGMTIMTKDVNRLPEFEIAIATTPLFQSFEDSSGQGSAFRVGGLKCLNRLEALQRIMEHEMIHLAELLIWDDSNCAARRFRGISKRLFGHTESNHQLLTPKDVARKKFKIRSGDEVAFKINGVIRRGTVNRITKRATVLVKDAQGVLYDDGERYLKYYVPLPYLKRIA